MASIIFGSSLLTKVITLTSIAINTHPLTVKIEVFQKPIYIPRARYVLLKVKNHVANGKHKGELNNGPSILSNTAGRVEHKVKDK
jgi:hypothetical protein